MASRPETLFDLLGPAAAPAQSRPPVLPHRQPDPPDAELPPLLPPLPPPHLDRPGHVLALDAWVQLGEVAVALCAAESALLAVPGDAEWTASLDEAFALLCQAARIADDARTLCAELRLSRLAQHPAPKESASAYP